MKCVWHWKWKSDPFEGEEYGKVRDIVAKAMEENPDDFPTMSPGIHKGRGVGFRLVEGTYVPDEIVRAWVDFKLLRDEEPVIFGLSSVWSRL